MVIKFSLQIDEYKTEIKIINAARKLQKINPLFSNNGPIPGNGHSDTKRKPQYQENMYQLDFANIAAKTNILGAMKSSNHRTLRY